jgi:transcriptional regulator with XRE-family HTH domain
MAQTEDIVGALKTALKRKGVTYAQVAKALQLSESTVKRLFATGNLSLKRLQQICALVDLELGDLVDIADELRRNVVELTEEQELTLVADPKLLLAAFLLLNHYTFKQITDDYRISELEGIRLLAKLDRLKIIDLLPDNKVRMRLARNFNWRKNGPIQRFFEEQVQSEFFQSRFDGPGELRFVLNGMVSDQSIKIFHQRLQRLAAEFEGLVKEDRKLELVDRHGTTVIVGIRPWGLGLFEQLRRV